MTRMFRRVITAALFLLLPINVAFSVERFVIRDIRVEGLQRIKAGTVFNYLPIKVGDEVTPGSIRTAIRALFKTGFFKDVRLEREGNVLIVFVTERATITSIKIDGAKEIPTDELKKSLRHIGLAEGRVFNRSLLEKVENELKKQYYSVGKYAVRIRTTVTPLTRNRVGINIDISEGKKSAIQSINLVGNTKFIDKKLLKQFKLKSKSSFGIFKSRYLYSKQKLLGDIERLRNYYQNRGYLEFNVESTQVTITPDKENIFVTINISEGKKYTISDIKLAGKFVLPEEEIRKLITVKRGEVFSRKRIATIVRDINEALGDAGYAFAKVNVLPKKNEKNGTVSFTFHIDPGYRVYVRRIIFTGNAVTRDVALRREMRQLEGAWLSGKKLRRSKIRLQRLGFFDAVNIKTERVPGTTDQVDVIVSVKERQTGNIIFSIGYSDVDGALFRASVSQRNLFGTGKLLSVAFDNSQSTKNFSVRYNNPYHTIDGVSRGFNVYVTEVDAEEANTAAYSTKAVGVGIFYGIPISEKRKLRVGLAAETLEIETTTTSAQIAKDFVAVNGPKNDVIRTNISWTYDTLNNAIFPTKGSLHKVSAEITLPGSDLEYYRLTYEAGRFWPVATRSTFRVRGELSYGNGYGDTTELPFYKNFFAGGSTTVRGYKSRSLGPRDTASPNDPIGGSKRVLGTIEYLFPLPGAADDDKRLRLSLFIDGGMVFGPNEDMDLGKLRYSTGISLNWFTVVGPLRLSFSTPLNDEPGDNTESFQFSLGVPFK